MLMRINRARRRLNKLVLMLLAMVWLLPPALALAQTAAPAGGTVRSRFAGPTAIGAGHNWRY